MLKIRLRKPGKTVKRRYHWKIVVMEARTARDAKFVEEIGHYDPSRKLLKFDIARYESWVGKGAQPTQTVGSLFKRYKKNSENS
ncbi:MAG: 30S ribosomal protein S16 [Candidatus Omnitrophica bacterium]|nr:30S ribosomal protein S16 [Candidatus Omnitrophota bacterium]